MDEKRLNMVSYKRNPPKKARKVDAHIQRFAYNKPFSLRKK